MTEKHPVEQIAETVGGTIDEMGVLPDGSGFAAMSMPLPDDHWYTTDGREAPPMPFRMGTNDLRRNDFNEMVRAAAKYAIRSSTDNGKIEDFDPDAMVQNFVVWMLGYHTPDGLCHDKDVPEFDPDPVPDRYPGQES